MFLLVRSYAYNELVETVISSYLTRKKEKEVLRCEGERFNLKDLNEISRIRQDVKSESIHL